MDCLKHWSMPQSQMAAYNVNASQRKTKAAKYRNFSLKLQAIFTDFANIKNLGQVILHEFLEPFFKGLVLKTYSYYFDNSKNKPLRAITLR